jgi:hypothetical protein
MAIESEKGFFRKFPDFEDSFSALQFISFFREKVLFTKYACRMSLPVLTRRLLFNMSMLFNCHHAKTGAKETCS